MRPGRALALAALCAAPAAAQEAGTPPFEVEPVMECRARAIVQLNLADWSQVGFGRDATLAIKEQADFAIVLGYWGARLDSVAMASRDLAAGERLLIENATQVNAYAREWESDGPYDTHLARCTGIVWGAARAVIDRLLIDGADRRR
ncbi:MAG TPA: hypothetical protein VFR34_04335 [Paracoccaceae bacterium]|nr:hypothetical protein [Paracoccaceae bacterium]